ncbi:MULTISPECIES: hypothetical protein [unclassified Ruegeria]|uniref:hypothetical protein n=1 Tax=unclassified Ruegeria TaxID=2625375 RepID=UPI001491F02D|nr:MULTISPECIES: hypothetical protein [unclassified Ruegeria]NOD46204.1 hypothetical protein [Ruegeria sp. HKCCD5849]NOD50496.1 hypothetical protein [Ruegeria sp. HKCCD5851]NOD67312.1 hypothetical protein [Ruegeria sp. HKCCD7303]
MVQQMKAKIQALLAGRAHLVRAEVRKPPEEKLQEEKDHVGASQRANSPVANSLVVKSLVVKNPVVKSPVAKSLVVKNPVAKNPVAKNPAKSCGDRKLTWSLNLIRRPAFLTNKYLSLPVWLVQNFEVPR